MSDSYQQQVANEDRAKKARQEWYQTRVENIHQRVSAHDVLSRNGVTLSGGGLREEQFSCPFHGTDRRPSARIYPESPRSPSHAWCFVCQERWDAITLWKKFNGEEKNFSRILTEIEQAFGLETPDMPREALGGRPDHNLTAFDALYEVCENRLKRARSAYYQLGDMPGFLSASSILDKIYYRVSQGKVAPEQGLASLRRLLDKIGEKIRLCPDG